MAARSQLQHNLRSVTDQSKCFISLVSGLSLINSLLRSRDSPTSPLLSASSWAILNLGTSHTHTYSTSLMSKQITAH
jgi:hypothetical protein